MGFRAVTTNAFDVTPAATSQLLITSQPPSTVTAGDTFGLTVTALDQYGNETPGFVGSVTIALKSDPGSGTLDGTLVMSAAAGIADFSDLTLDKAGTGYTIQATGSGVSAATTSAFDVTPAAASQLLITSQPPSTVTAGNTFGLTVSAEDQYGNVATGFAGGVTIALKSNPGSGTLGGTLSEDSASGVAAFSNLTLDQAAPGYTIQATGTGLTDAITSSFNVTPAAASQLVITSQPPSSVTAGNSFGLTVMAEDQYGNQTPGYTGSVTIALKNNPGSGSLLGTLSENAISGAAAFGGLTLDKAAGGYTIQASGTGISAASTNSFDVTPATASQLLVTSQPPSTLSAGSMFGVTITAADRYGNTATGFAGSVKVALKSNPGSGMLAGTASRVPVAGVAVFSDLVLDSIANGYTIQATSMGLSAATTNTFNVTPAVASQLLVTTEPPSTLTAGTTFGLTVTAEDPFGNIAPGFVGTVTIALKSNPGDGTLGGTLMTNADAGVAGFAGLTLDEAANGYTIQVTAAGVTGAITGSFDVTPAAASQLLVTAEPPSSITAGSAFGLTVTALDPYQNVATAFAGSVTIGLKSNPVGGSLGGTLTKNASSGIADFSGLTLEKAGTAYTIQGTSTGLTSATTSEFNVTPAAASQLLVTVEPPSTLTAGSTFGLTVTAFDPYGNVATAFAGAVAIALKSNPAGGTLGGTVSLSASSGVAAFSHLIEDKAGNGYTIQATGPGLTSVTTSSFNVTPAAASRLVVTTQPPSKVPAGSKFTMDVSAEDAYGNVVTTASGTVTVALSKKRAGVKLSGKLSVTFSGGVAAFSRLSINKPGKAFQLKSTNTKLGNTLSNPFNVTPAISNHAKGAKGEAGERRGKG